MIDAVYGTDMSFAATLYAMGRKVLGHNTWFGKD
jgi:hypothetical protein